MNTDKIKYVLTAEECKSFTKAAEKLGITPSGLNRQISSFEKELKTTLFVRSKKGVRVARGTVKIFQRLKTIYKQEEFLKAEISEFHNILSGQLLIGAYYSVAASWLPDVLKEFCELHPNVEIKIIEGVNKDFIDMLSSGAIDCAFLANPPPDLDWYPLIKTEYVGWIPPGSPLAKKVAVTPEELFREPMIYPQAHKDTDIDYFLERKKIKPSIKLESNDPGTAFSLVSKGLGVSLNNRLMSQSLRGEAVIKPFSPREKLEIGIAIPPIEAASPLMLAFLALAQKHKLTLFGE